MPRRRYWFPILMISGFGLLGVTMFLLLSAFGVLSKTVAATATFQLEVVSRHLRAALASPAVLDFVPAGLRFEVAGQQLVVPDELGWIVAGDPAAARDLVVEDRLEQVARAEFAEHDSARAVTLLDQLLAGPLLRSQRLQVLADKAWVQRRTGDEAGCAASIALAGELVAGLPSAATADPVVANGIATLVRLAIVRTGGVDRVLRAAAVRVDHDELAAALAGLDVSSADTATMEGSSADNSARRRLLCTVAANLAATLPSMSPVAQAVDDQLLLFLPGLPTGRGALLTPAEWFTAVRQAEDAGRMLGLPWPPGTAPHTGLDPRQFLDTPGLIANQQPPEVHGPDPGALLLDSPFLLMIASPFVLMFVFVLSLVQQLRGDRREMAAARQQTEFLTTVTHELKTPLASIRLLGEMLAEGRASGREAEYHGMLVVESSRLAMLIENVLDLGRMERGERAYDLRSLDLSAVVAETVALFRPLAERDGLRVAVHEGLGPAARVRADRSALVQALLNVLDNARKYGAAGGRIEVALAPQGTTLRVAVRDFGPGVPAAERERIFDRFVRGAAQQSGAIPGVGIGLYLARTIARRLGGDLVHGAPADGGAGAEFAFCLPAEPA